MARADLPNNSPINEEPGLENDVVRRLSQSLNVSTHLWVLPGMNGDAEGSAGRQTGHK